MRFEFVEDEPEDDFGFGLRNDGSQKGLGFFGELKTPDNKSMTELSIGTNIDGKEIEIPSIVPTLSSSELEHLRKGGDVTESIINKASEHAKSRISEGKSPFAQKGEQISKKSKKIAESFGFFGLQPKAETIEKIRKPLVQKLLLPGAEFTSSALGGPGDIASVLHKYIAKPVAEKITGQEESPYEETAIGKLLPTSGQLHGAFETLADEKIRPETTGEELLATGSGFLGSIFGLGGGKFLGKGKVPFSKKVLPSPIRNAVAAFVPAATMVGTEKAGLPPWAQASATVVSSLLAHRLTGKGLKQINKEMFDKVNELAKDVVLPSDELLSRIDKFKTTLAKGGTTGPKGRIRSLLSELEAKASGGAIPLEELMEFRKNINEISKEFTGKQLKGSEKFWSGARNVVDETIDDYSKLNPKFGSLYRETNSLFRGLKESQSMENFLKSNKKLSTLAGGAGAIVLPLLKAVTGPGLLKGAIAAKSILFTRAMIKNPGLRKAWKDVLKSSAKEEVRATTRSLKEFNDIAKKEGLQSRDKNQSRFEFID